MSWAPEHFNHRHYTIEDPAFDKARRIEVVLKVNGKQVAALEVREPGMIAIVSKPTTQGIDLHVVEGSGKRHTDYHTPLNPKDGRPEDWHLAAIGVNR